MNYAYSQMSNRLFPGEPVIKDVCAICNNEHLSKLDNYLSSLFNEQLQYVIEAGEDVTFRYSYDLLLRVLLKISYNASRVANNDKNTKTHKKFARYILNAGYSPQIMLRLQIVTSSKKIDLNSGEQSDFVPQLFRCGYIPYDGVLHHRFLIKLVAINSYWFYLIIPFKSEPAHKWREMLEGFANWRIPSGIFIEPTQHSLYVPVNKTTYFVPQLLGSMLNAEFI